MRIDHTAPMGLTFDDGLYRAYLDNVNRKLAEWMRREEKRFLEGPVAEPLGILGAKVLADNMTDEELVLYGDPTATEPQGVINAGAK